MYYANIVEGNFKISMMWDYNDVFIGRGNPLSYGLIIFIYGI